MEALALFVFVLTYLFLSGDVHPIVFFLFLIPITWIGIMEIKNIKKRAELNKRQEEFLKRQQEDFERERQFREKVWEMQRERERNINS